MSYAYTFFFLTVESWKIHTLKNTGDIYINSIWQKTLALNVTLYLWNKIILSFLRNHVCLSFFIVVVLLYIYIYVATSNDLVSHHVILLNHCFGPRMPQLVMMCSFYLIISRINLFILTFTFCGNSCVSFCVERFIILNICFVMCFCPVCGRAAFILSAELIIPSSSSPLL